MRSFAENTDAVITKAVSIRTRASRSSNALNDGASPVKIYFLNRLHTKRPKNRSQFAIAIGFRVQKWPVRDLLRPLKVFVD